MSESVRTKRACSLYSVSWPPRHLFLTNPREVLQQIDAFVSQQ